MASTMMSLLRSAMDHAYENVQSRPPPIECLNETSKFYELAIILINGGLELIKEEPKDRIPETSRKKMLPDLIELQDLLHERLNHTKCLIIEKDKELIERLENGFRLRQALDSKENEARNVNGLDRIRRTNSEPLMGTNNVEDSKTENQSSNVAEMIKNHELIKNWLRIEDAVQRNADGSSKKQERKLDKIEKRVCGVVARLDMFINRNNDPEEEIGVNAQKKQSNLPKYPVSKNQKRNTVEDFANKDTIIARLMEERHESSLQTMAMEENYMLLINNCYNEFWAYDIETNIREDMFVYVLREVAKDWSTYDETESMKMQLTDEIYKSVFVETINDIRIKLGFEMQKIQNVVSECRRESTIQDEELVYKKAFVRRCENLLLAETEVDLLGDQVEALQDLLRKIYVVLVHNPSVSTHNFEVMDVLKLIREELSC